MRATIAVCETLMDEANALALIVGESEADFQTFTHAGWEDSSGNKFACASSVVKPSITDIATRTLSAPDYAPDADVTAAETAQAALVLWSGDGAKPQAQTGKITAYIHDDELTALQALADMGLSVVKAEET